MMRPLSVYQSPAFVAFVMSCWCMYSVMMEATTTISGNEMDHLALVYFKNGITKDPIGGLRSWNSTIYFCDWNGVACDHQRQRVKVLNLSSLHLSGSISAHITNLTALIELDLSHNMLQGPLLQNIGRLFHLQHIDLYDNYITGEIPISLSNCKDLNFLNFRFNEFIGTIPSELIFLSKLQVLDLYSNNLSGNIPPSLGNLSYLVTLSIALNGLEGSCPGEVGRIPSLQKLNFRGNHITGTIPSELLNITSLSYLLFAQNQLEGSLPGEVGNTFPQLKQFAGGLNHFTGPIPASLSNASGLEILDFASNELSGPVPISFGSLQNMVRLNFGDNLLHTDENDGLTFITSLTNCTSLEVFALDSNRFHGLLPDSIANLSSQLNILSLGSNQLSGRFPAGIERYVNLSLLSLEDNFFTGRVPMGLGRLHLLQELFLYQNYFFGQIPSSLGNLTQLNILNLASNDFIGAIPPTLSSCENLQQLDLSNNRLNGAVPAGIMRISSLSISLNFSRNYLIGSLPDEVQNLQSLGKLDLSKNKLSGKIPAVLSKCIGLESLMLGGNLFEGTIPLSLSALSGVQELDLSHNHFSGSVPEFLEKLSSLQYLNLSFNFLEGELPRKGVFGNASAFSIVGNYKLCGGIASLHLPACFMPTSRIHGDHASMKRIIAIAIAAFVLLLAACYLVSQNLVEKLKRRNLPSMPFLAIGPEQVSYDEILKATDGFSSSKLIGEGSYGSVYIGENLCHEEVVAIKVLCRQRNTHVSQNFRYECESLRDIRHRNLVKIITSCSSVDFRGNNFKAMVYEYMPNGNLDTWLHPVEADRFPQMRRLTFMERLNIAIDVASALEYLHHHCYRCIVHCDLKPSNVLLDNDMIARVGDFGLSRSLPEVIGDCSEDQLISSRVKGSVGYLAPEYGTGAPASTSGDAYSYGILLLEILTGKRPTDPMLSDGLTLHSYAKSAFPDQVIEIVDSTLITEEVTADDQGCSNIVTQELWESLACVLRVAISCSTEIARERMDMRQVSVELRRVKDKFLGAGIYKQRRNAARSRGEGTLSAGV